MGEVLRDVSDDRRTSRARVMGDNFRQTAVRGGEVVMACLCCRFFVKTHLDKKSVHSVTVSLDFWGGEVCTFCNLRFGLLACWTEPNGQLGDGPVI